MTSFLFWNINRKPLEDIIFRIVNKYNIDVLMLAECTINPGELLLYLNERSRYKYHDSSSIGCSKIKIFTRFSRTFIQPLSETDRLTIRHLKLPGLTEVLLAVDHFPSKFHFSDASQAGECSILAEKIRKTEDEIGHKRTIIVGDLNMNPFEDGVVNSNGLHAVMTRKIAKKKSRIVQGNEYFYFYNPMWSLFGDGSKGPPGTYYYSKAEHKVYFWNMFDQVLLRPDLIDLFSNDDLMILDSDGKNLLLSQQGIPDKNVASDHLPLYFKLSL